jgi:hypothetical protein
MAHSLIHALSACMALASFHADAGLEGPGWQKPIATAAMKAIERGDVDAETFHESMAAVRKEIDRDANNGRWHALGNVYNRCDELAQIRGM